MSVRRIVLLLAIGVAVPLVVADDINPPPWRGEPRTTFALWEFSTPDIFPPPDVFDNPFGPPELEVNPFGDGWLPSYNGRQGVWTLSGDIFVDIPNFPEPLDMKWIWIQLTWAPIPFEPNPFPTVVEELTPGGPYAGESINVIPIGPEDWIHETFLIELFPNPDRERIHIFGDIYVDELVIDTICIPEPAGMLMLVVALAGLLTRRM